MACRIALACSHYFSIFPSAPRRIIIAGISSCGCPIASRRFTCCSLLHSPNPNFPRRFFLASLASSLLQTLDRYPSSAEGFVDPSEQALVETLDARDSLASLCEDIKSFTSRTVSKADLQNPRRTFGGIYESLESSLPKLAEQFQLEEDIVQELLESLASAQDAFLRSCYASNPGDGLEKCFKFLQVACVQVDELLEQVPTKTVESVQLLRGVRPIA